MAFRVGQKVVCVDDEPRNVGSVIHGVRINNGMDGLKSGEIYTIRGFHPSWTTGEPGIYLQEIRRAVSKLDGSEISFFASRFRPVQTTDISIFTAMLNPSRETVSG